MSHSDRHIFTPLNKDSKALTGQRLARVIAKKDKEGNYPSEYLQSSLCVSVPMVDIDAVQANIEALQPHLISMVQDAQDALIRDIRIRTGHSEVSNEEISVSAVVAYLDSAAAGGRLTGEYLTLWLTENYSVQAAEFIAAVRKFSDDCDQWTPDQLIIIEQKTNVLFSVFSGFASGKYSPDIPKCKLMMKFGEFCGSSMDARLSGYVAKAASIKAMKEAELSMDALGF